MFISRVQNLKAASSSMRAANATPTDQDVIPSAEINEKEFTFNIKRLVIAAVLLIVILSFAIGTAFFEELTQIHTMLVHAFELVLGILAGLLGGEAIAKAEKS